MGLDMYLNAETKLRGFGKNESTGACGGLFPFAPKLEEERIEIGYWRKAYEVCDTILCRVGNQIEDTNCVDFYLSKEDCESILRTAEERIEEENYNNEWEKQDWEDTIEFFKKAIIIYELDKTAEIYYHHWY